MFESPSFNCTDVGTFDERAELENLILELQENEIAHSNFGCKRYKLDIRHIPWLASKITYGLNQIVINSSIQYQELLDQAGYKDTENSISDCWVNVNSPGARNELHCHEKAQFTAVYFLKAHEDSGELVLKHPANVTNQCHPAAPGVQDIIITPKEGGLVIFPGWVPHEVWQNNSGKIRITVAFNLNIVDHAPYLNKGAT
jgi:hypothetical protein